MAQESRSDSLEVCARLTSLCPGVRTSTYLPWQERLKSHAESFNGLLSLIPAKYYYGEDTSVWFTFLGVMNWTFQPPRLS